MFVETVTIERGETGELKSINIRMGDKRFFDAKERIIEKGYSLIVRDGNKLKLLLIECPRALKYPKEWLDSLEFKLLLEGQDLQLIYGGPWVMQAYSMYRMAGQPQALKWLVSINGFETYISSYSTDIEKLPSVKKLTKIGKRLNEALRVFDATDFDAFLVRLLLSYPLEAYHNNYKDQP